MLDEEQAADLLIEFGRSHGAFSMVRGDRPVIDDYDASIEFVLSDDTGMDTYDHNSHFRHFPLSLHFRGKSAADIASGLKAHLDTGGLSTHDAPEIMPNGSYRVRPAVFVRQNGSDVEVTAHNFNG